MANHNMVAGIVKYLRDLADSLEQHHSNKDVRMFSQIRSPKKPHYPLGAHTPEGFVYDGNTTIEIGIEIPRPIGMWVAESAAEDVMAVLHPEEVNNDDAQIHSPQSGDLDSKSRD